MADGMTTTTHADFIPEVWAGYAISQYEQNLVIANLVRSWNPLFAGGKSGDSATVPVFKRLQVSDVQAISEARQATFTPSGTDDAGIKLTIDQKKYVSVEVTDPLRVFANQPLIQMYAQANGFTLAEYVDGALADVLPGYSAHSAVDLTGLTAKTDTEIKDALALAVQYLNEYNIPLTERAFVFCPALYTQIGAADWFINADYVSGRPIETGKIGSIFGVDVFMTTNLYTTISSAVTTTHNLLLHKDAMGFADPFGIDARLSMGDARYTHAQATSLLYFGYVSSPRDGTNNYAVVDIQTT